MRKEYLDVIEAILSDEYARGYNDGANHGIEITETKDYEQGLNDAWKCKEYKEKQKQTDDEIKVGDEIYSLDKNYKSVVTAVFDTCRGVTAVYFTQNGKWYGDLLENLHKTGRRFPEIANILKQMQEVEE